MYSQLALEQTSHRTGQTFPSRILVCKQGVAAHRWNDVSVKNSPRRRPFQETPVGMPGFGKDWCCLIGFTLHLHHARMPGNCLDVRVFAVWTHVGSKALNICNVERLIRKSNDL